MPSMDTLDGYSFAFNARVDLVGQGCDVATKIVRHSKQSYALKMQLQKRHAKGRIYMTLSSDNDTCVNLNIVTKTPGQLPVYAQQTIGSKGLATWQYCSYMHRTKITRDTVWEVSVDKNGKSLPSFTISFDECENNEEQILAENWSFRKNWSYAEDTVDSSNVPSNSDPARTKVSRVAALQASSLKGIRKSARRKTYMK